MTRITQLHRFYQILLCLPHPYLFKSFAAVAHCSTRALVTISLRVLCTCYCFATLNFGDVQLISIRICTYANLCSRCGAWVDCTFQLPVANHPTLTRTPYELQPPRLSRVQYRSVVVSMVDSPISVIRTVYCIAILISFRRDICGTPFDLQLGSCANISALSPTILFPHVRAPTLQLSVVTTVFWTEAGCRFQIVVFQWTINDRKVTYLVSHSVF